MNAEAPNADLVRNPALLALLNALVDRIDAIPFAERSRDIVFPLNDRSWPAFFGIDHPQERTFVWQLLERLMREPGFTLRLDERRIARDLDIWDRTPKIIVTKESELLLREITGRQPSVKAVWLSHWRRAVEARFGEGALVSRLMARPIAVFQRTPEEVLERFADIAHHSDSDLMLHEVASRQFWGLSKVLVGQQEAIALLLNQAECPFPDKPVQLVVQSLTDDLGAPVLFIENAATFESVASGRLSEAKGFILVYASGYKASARRIRKAGGSSIYFAPSTFEGNPALPRAFLDWFYSTDMTKPVHFWGDLDFAGLGILKELRVVFPQAQAWKPGYDQLLEHLDAGESHAPDEAKKSGQSDPTKTGCCYADEVLLPALRHYGRFVDQESL